MISMKGALLLVALLLSAPAYARIGETTKQLEKRYGRPLKAGQENGETLRFSFRGYTIVVGLDQGVSQCEVYERRDGSRLTEGEIWGLLDANASSKSPWRAEPEEGVTNYVYRSRDKRTRVAIYVLASHKLLVTSKPYLARFGHLTGSSDQTEMEGF